MAPVLVVGFAFLLATVWLPGCDGLGGVRAELMTDWEAGASADGDGGWSGDAPTCGTGCSNDLDCSSAADNCTICPNGKCTVQA